MCFSRTPGSRQPSPSDEELNKNNGVVVLENPHVGHHYPHPFPPPPHHPHTLTHLDSHFEHVMTLDPGFEGGQQASYNPSNQQQPNQQQQAMDSPTVLSTSFDVQVSISNTTIMTLLLSVIITFVTILLFEISVGSTIIIIKLVSDLVVCLF